VSVKASVGRLRAIGVALGAVLIAAAASCQANAANIFEKNGYLSGPRYDSNLPACDNWWALNTIKSRFATKEGRFWVSNLEITNFEDIKEVAFRPWADGTIPRRFCAGRALISDGVWRTVRYSIIEDAGMISWSFGVEWCVVGLDRNWAYSPACKEAAP
jgi:hypothetical protein